MSVSTEVQRTLVKSPPELWSELSNPDALARHLSGLGEIRITAVEPETKVEWESDGASGVVQLKQSGWGTKVTLSVTHTTPVLEEDPPEPEAVAEPTASEPEPIAVEPVAEKPEPTLVEPVAAESEQVAAESQVEPDNTSEPTAPEQEADARSEQAPPPKPEPQRGFFARLFRRRKARSEAPTDASPESEVAAEQGTAAEPEAVTEPKPDIEVVALAAPDPVYPEPPVEAESEIAEPAENLASELASMEAQMTVETTELLTGVLDRLGAAHHRPFSRG